MASNAITSIKHSSASGGGGGGDVDFASWPALSLLDLSDNCISRYATSLICWYKSTNSDT